MRQYQVRIPPWARQHYEGQSRLRLRFSDSAVGEAWVAGIVSQLARLRAGAERESIGIQRAREIEFQAAASLWLSSETRRPVTVRGYKQALKQPCLLVGRANLSELTLTVWETYLAARRAAGASDDALLRERFVISATAKWAQQRGYQVAPALLVLPKLRPLPVVVRRYEPDRVEAAIRRLTGQDRIVAELAGHVGLRAAEVRACRVEWIDLGRRLLTVPHCREFSPKGGRSRTVPIPESTAGLLRDWIGDRTEGILLPSRYTGRGSGMLRIRYVVDRLQAAGVVRHGLHDLRHHCLSQLAARGCPPRYVQEVAGHRLSSTTDRYTHVGPGWMEEVRRAMDTQVDTAVDRGERRGKVLRVASPLW